MITKPVLLVNEPGIVTSFEIPYNPYCSNIINVKKVLKRLNGDTLVSSMPVQNDPSESTVAVTTTTSLPPPTRASHYDNIIEMLEKKYREPVLSKNDSLTIANHNNNSVISDDSSMMQSSPVNHHKSSKLTSAANSSGANKKSGNGGGGGTGANKYDTYDLEDPFLDDSEVLEQVNVQLKSKKLKTKHDGFFVSSGRLEVETVVPVKLPALSTSSVNNHMGNTNIHNESSSSKTSAIITTSKNTSTKSTAATSTNKKKKAQAVIPPVHTDSSSEDTKSTLDTGNATENLLRSSGLSDSSINQETSVVSLSTPEAATTTISVPKPKPPPPKWYPSAVEVAALDAFREAVSTSGLKATEKYFPYPLESALTALDTTAPIKSIGYLQAVCDATGGVYTIGRLRLLLSRLQQEATAKKVKVQLDAMTEQLKFQLKKRVFAKPPPPPAVLTTPSTSSATSSSAGAVPSIDTALAAVVMSANANTNANGVINAVVAVHTASNNDHSSTTVATSNSTIEESTDENEEAIVVASGKEAREDVEAASASSESGLIADATSTSGSSSATVSSLMLPEYHWICRWDGACRVLLFDCVQLAQQWVELETAYRGKLTQADKKCRSEEQICLLDEKEVVTDMLNSICQYCFPTITTTSNSSSIVDGTADSGIGVATTSDCLNGDVAYLRKAIIGERQRRKNKEKKALQQQQAAAIASSAEVPAVSAVGSVGVIGDTCTSVNVIPVVSTSAPAVTIPTVKSPKRSSAVVNSSGQSPSNKKKTSANTQVVTATAPPSSGTTNTLVVPTTIASSATTAQPANVAVSNSTTVNAIQG